MNVCLINPIERGARRKHLELDSMVKAAVHYFEINPRKRKQSHLQLADVGLNPMNFFEMTSRRRKHHELDSMDKYFICRFFLPRLALGYLSAVLKKDGHHVVIAEMLLQSLDIDDVETLIESNNIEFIGISSYSYNLPNTLRLINRFRNKYPDKFIAVGGYFPTLATDDTLNKMPADCYVIGEGEETLRELVGKLHKHEDWHSVDGIAFKDDAKGIVRTKPRRLIEDLDTLPFPDRISSPLGTETAFMLTARGCYGRCSYCSINAFYSTCTGKEVRRRSPENVIQEIISLQDKGTQCIIFVDDNFAIASKASREWFDRFYTLIKNNNIQMNCRCDFRANEVVSAPDILEKFVDIGLDYISMGLESFVQPQLDFYNKGIKVEQNIEALRIVNGLGIDFHFNTILFDPRSTVDEIIECVNVIKSLDFLSTHNNVLSYNFLPLTAFEGTEARRYVVEKGLFRNNTNYYSFLHPETASCYEAWELWRSNKKLVAFDEYYYMHAIATDHCDEKLTASLLQLVKDEYYMHSDVILYICDLVKRGYRNPELISTVERRFETQFDEHVRSLSALGDEVLRYVSARDDGLEQESVKSRGS